MPERSEHSVETELPDPEELRDWIHEGRRIFAETYAEPPAPEYEFNLSEAELGPDDKASLEVWNKEQAEDLSALAIASDDLHLTSKIPGFRKQNEAQARILNNRGDLAAIRSAVASSLKWRDQSRRLSFLCGYSCGIKDIDLVRELDLMGLVLRSDHEHEDFHRAITALSVTLDQPDLIDWSECEKFRGPALVEMAMAGGSTERRRALALVDPANSWNLIRPVYRAIAESTDPGLRETAIGTALEMDCLELRALALSELSGGDTGTKVRELAVAASEAPQLHDPSRHRVIHYGYHAAVFSQPTISARDNVLGSLAVSTGDLAFAAEIDSDRHAQRVMSRISVEEDRVELVRSFDGPYERAVALSEVAKRRQDPGLAIEALGLAEEVPGGRVAMRCIINLLEVLRKPDWQLRF